MAIQYAVVRVKGMEPETFVVIGIDFADGAPMKEMSKQMTEAEMRDHLEKSGFSPHGIDVAIRTARENEM